MRKLLFKLCLNTIAILPLAVVQAIGAFLGVLAYVGSKHYRSLFRPQYEAVVIARGLPFKLWAAVRASGMLFSDSLWIWRNPKKALTLVFRGTGDCATIDWTFLGLSIPQLALIAFLSIAAYALLLAKKRI